MRSDLHSLCARMTVNDYLYLFSQGVSAPVSDLSVFSLNLTHIMFGLIQADLSSV